ncbi:MAG: mechanosensitive ion channel family protein [Deltaproteobacteria bacterium]|nr:mechanosensitive ion channel family protein [Deltaproteobacteria bacterium]
MFEDLLGQTYYGNTATQWLTALGVIVGAVIVGKVIYWIFGNVIKKFTEKTKTKLDDLIIDMIEEPIVFIITVSGVWVGLGTLTLPEPAERWTSNIIHFLIILTIAWLLARLLDAFVREYLVPITEKSETDLDDQLLPIVRKGMKISIWAVGIIVALNNAGYDVGAMIAALGIGGLALAMAAKDTVSNIFGGFTIFTDRPFSLNDRVKVAGYDGFIREIGVRSTRLETLEGRVVTIPNSKFSDMPVENISLEPSRKVVLNLGLTYDTKPEKMQEAMEILKDIAAGTDGLEDKVLVSFNAFGDSAMNILFIYYIKTGADILGAQTDVNMSILNKFTSAGLDFAFPTQTLYTKQV